MKPLRLSAIAGTVSILCLGLVSNAAAQISDSVSNKITRAMSAGPAVISAQATIMDTDGTILRKGNNGWTCLPGVSLIPGDNHPMCNDATWMKWMAAAASGSAFFTNLVGTSYMLQGDALVNNNDPAANDPNVGDMWIQEGPHLMMLYPTAEEYAHLPRDPKAGGPYVMWDKTPLVHVMVPISTPDH
ncbi:MAG: hypothetical protein COA84_04645 [Robiginitomaculum sp.]|nr:MAG: hypothetical protein COA84_04645 [Robiginitomaculum sp.]